MSKEIRREIGETDKATKAKRKFEDFMEEALTKTEENRTKARAEIEKKEEVAGEASGSGLTEDSRERGLKEAKEHERLQRGEVERPQGEKRSRDTDSDEELTANTKKVFAGEFEVNH